MEFSTNYILSKTFFCRMSIYLKKIYILFSFVTPTFQFQIIGGVGGGGGGVNKRGVRQIS